MDDFDDRDLLDAGALWAAVGEDLKNYTVQRDPFAPTGWVYERKRTHDLPGKE